MCFDDDSSGIGAAGHCCWNPVAVPVEPQIQEIIEGIAPRSDKCRGSQVQRGPDSLYSALYRAEIIAPDKGDYYGPHCTRHCPAPQRLFHQIRHPAPERAGGRPALHRDL